MMNLPSIGKPPTGQGVHSNTSSLPKPQSSSIGDGGGIKMKSQLTRESSSSKATSPQNEEKSLTAGDKKAEEKKAMFSPTSQSHMSNFFNTKGPIRPASMLPTQAMVNGPIMPMGHGAFQLHSRPGQSQQEMMAHGAEDYYDEEDEYGEDADYGPEGEPNQSQQRISGGRVLSLEEEQEILHYLAQSARSNREFLKVLNILQNDPELRPLIFEHEALLKALKDMGELKAEQMLSILTAAETEMYESSKKNEETQQLQRSQGLSATKDDEVKKEMRSSEVQTIKTEDGAVEQAQIETLRKANGRLEQERDDLLDQVARLQQEASNKAVTRDGSESALQKRVDQLLSKERDSNISIRELEDQVKAMRSERADLQAQQSTQVAEAQDEINQLQQKLSQACNKPKQHDKPLLDDFKSLKAEKVSIEATLNKMTDACEKLRGQLEAANLKATEADKRAAQLQDENQGLHLKVAQAKNSIILGGNSEGTSTPELAARPDSSKLRVRLDDSSQISKELAPSALSGDTANAGRRRGNQRAFSPDVRLSKAAGRGDDPTALDYFIDDEMESINDNIPQARAAELIRLREENTELKGKLEQIRETNRLTSTQEQQPLGMTTFSPARDSQSKIATVDKVSSSEDMQRLQKGLAEVGRRLFNLMGKLRCDVSPYESQPWSTTLLKDLVYDIDERAQTLLSSNHGSSMNQQRSGFDSYRTAGPSQPQAPQVQGLKTRTPNHQSRPALTDNQLMDNSGHFGPDTTMDMTNYQRDNSGERSRSGDRSSRYDIKSQLLDEKERRLTIQESLQKTREEQFLYRKEIDALKTELRKRPQISTFERKIASQEDVDDVQRQLDLAQDENVTLKLQVSDLEAELIDERHKQRVSYDVTLEGIKASVQEQVIDQKMRFEEQILKEKEVAHKQRVTIQGLEERICILKDQVASQRGRLTSIEKESIDQAKQIYVLNQELDYESIKNNQIATRTDRLSSEIQARGLIEKSKLDQVVAQYEKVVQGLESRLGELEATPFDKLAKEKLEREVEALRAENATLTKQKIISFNSSNQDASKAQMQIEAAHVQTKRARSVALRLAVRQKHSLNITRAFYMLKGQAKKSDGDLEDGSRSETKSSLYEQIGQLQTQNSDLVKQIGKLVRQFGTGKPVKLNLQGLLNSQSLDFILSGLKNTTIVEELNLGDNLLTDVDLTKIATRLRSQPPNTFSLRRLKLHANEFKEVWSFIDLLNDCGPHFTSLDFSKMIFSSPEAVQMLAAALHQLTSIQDLAMCNLEMFTTQNQDPQVNGAAATLFKQLGRLMTVRSLDLSKNRLPHPVVLTLLDTLPRLPKLQVLALSQVGLSDENSFQICQTVGKLRSLRRLNISNNSLLSCDSVADIVRALKDSSSELAELDLSKLRCGDGVTVFKELADLLITNKSMRVLALQRVGMTDALANFLCEPLVRAQQIETLKFDWNDLSGSFLEKYCRKMAAIGFSANLYGPGAPGNGGIDRNASSSLLASESGGEDLPQTGRSASQNNCTGLLALSLEGNEIGDRGAEAIASMIQKESDATRSLKTINLNECSIGNVGFQKLKKALGMRGSLTKSCNLTHIGIKVERNLFDM